MGVGIVWVVCCCLLRFGFSCGLRVIELWLLVCCCFLLTCWFLCLGFTWLVWWFGFYVNGIEALLVRCFFVRFVSWCLGFRIICLLCWICVFGEFGYLLVFVFLLLCTLYFYCVLMLRGGLGLMLFSDLVLCWFYCVGCLLLLWFCGFIEYGLSVCYVLGTLLIWWCLFICGFWCTCFMLGVLFVCWNLVVAVFAVLYGCNYGWNLLLFGFDNIRSVCWLVWYYWVCVDIRGFVFDDFELLCWLLYIVQFVGFWVRFYLVYSLIVVVCLLCWCVRVFWDLTFVAA